ncbi:MAG: flavin reductase [Eubacteriales bacterium]|nr:flavin reductase [Eubacteriales bacterium]
MDINALNKIGYGVYLLSASDGERDNASIINAVVQASMKPIMIGISVISRTYTNELIEKSGKFNITTISDEADYSLFEHFGMKSGREFDKFENFKDVARSENGLLYLTKWACAVFSVDVVEKTELGSHTFYIGKVSDAKILSEENPCTYAYYYSDIKPKPATAQTAIPKAWRCKICGFIYEGPELPKDYLCPLCGHGVDDFEPIY